MSSSGFFFHFLVPVKVQQWRVEIRTFNYRYILRHHQSCNFFIKGKTVIVGFDFAFSFFGFFFVILCFCYILLSHGDTEVNPGPKNCSTCFSVCQMNLNDLTAHNYVKSSSLQACNSVYKQDVINMPFRNLPW